MFLASLSMNVEILQKYERVVSRSEGLAMAQKYGAKYYETSAKTAENLNPVFKELNNDLVKLHVFHEKPDPQVY